MPYHVPSASLPALTGTCTETPVNMVFTCAGISSGPSISCTQPALSGATRVSAGSERLSALVQHVLLQAHDHVHQAAPYLVEEGHHLVEIRVVGRLQARLLRLGRRLCGLDRAGKRKVAGEELLLERNIFRLQPRDLRFQRGALVSYRLARPSHRTAGADRHLSGAAVEA